MPPTTLMANNILNYNFGGRAYSTPAFPADVYFGLSTTLVDATGLASVTEPSGGSYARVAYSNDATPQKWTVSSVGSLSNTDAIIFPKSTADWGTILSIFIADTATAGNVLWYCTLVPSFIVLDDTVVTFDANSIVMTIV